MEDYYLKDLERLKGQPKRTIGEYAKSEDFLVPKIFDTFEEAKKAKCKVLCRSEHVDEYNGASGLLDSPKIDKCYINPKDFPDDVRIYKNFESEEHLINYVTLTTKKVRDYTNIKRIEFKEFLKGISFSYWEYIEGASRIVVADSAIKERYHIFTKWGDKEKKNYSLWDNGKIASYNDALPKKLVNGLQGLIHTYESIRKLPNFDILNCPIMEFKSNEKGDYFLQYHRTRNFDPADFRIGKYPKRYKKALFSRGKTPKEGIEISVVLASHSVLIGKVNEDAVWDVIYSSGIMEANIRDLKCQIIDPHNKTIDSMLKITYSHYGLSTLFKPEIAVIQKKEKLVTDEESLAMSFEKDFYKVVKMHLIADGKKAFIRRLS